MLGKVVVLSELAGLVQSLVESMPKFGSAVWVMSLEMLLFLVWLGLLVVVKTLLWLRFSGCFLAQCL